MFPLLVRKGCEPVDEFINLNILLVSLFGEWDWRQKYRWEFISNALAHFGGVNLIFNGIPNPHQFGCFPSSQHLLSSPMSNGYVQTQQDLFSRYLIANGVNPASYQFLCRYFQNRGFCHSDQLLLSLERQSMGQAFRCPGTDHGKETQQPHEESTPQD